MTSAPNSAAAPVRRASRSRTQDASAPHKAAPPSPLPFVGPVTRTVREIVEVLPAWTRALLAALGALLLMAALLAVTAGLRTRRLRGQRAALLAEVGVLQDALFPEVPARVGGLGVSVAYRPADGGGGGGDFYDVFALDRGATGIIIGDVAGHGSESLRPATFIRHLVRSYMEAGMNPRAAIQLAGNVLDDQQRDDFATLVAAVYDASAGTLSYASAGHPAPVVSGPAWHEPLTAASSPPAGAGATTGLRQTTVALPPGSTVCFFTDGVTEARIGDGVFGRDRLERTVDALPVDATAGDLVEQVAAQSDRVGDDIAICLIRPEGAAAAGTVRVEEIEVTLSDLRTTRLRRFLDASGVAAAEATAALDAARPHLLGYGSALLRVRLADGRSGVDVVPVASPAPGADVAPVVSLH